MYTNSLLSTLNGRAGWNNLTGPTNVLFSDHSGRPIDPHSTNQNSMILGPAILELEDQKTFREPGAHQKAREGMAFR
jgi:hypothetical protein